MEIGKTQILQAARTTDNGCYLIDEENNEVLLPNAYVPAELKLGESISVFVYKDQEERPVATIHKPFAEKDQFAFLEVKQVNNVGAFLDWGLVKQLFVPFAEQAQKMEEGNRYVVFITEDEKTGRLFASSKLNDFIFDDNEGIEEGMEVELLPYKKTDLGVSAIINNQFSGLLFHSEVYKDIKIGEKCKGYIKRVREDGKIDLQLQPVGYLNVIDSDTQKVLDALQKNSKFLPLGDKSNPDDIKRELGMSKKAFKRAIGNLYKQKKVSLTGSSVTLL